MQRGSGWVALLERRLAQEKIPARVINASISGDTTSGGRSRLPALLREHRPTQVILELGANDALRGLPLSMTQTNLSEMARAARAAGAKVVVVGMQMPPNYGNKYGQEFAALFATVARSEGAALVPFPAEGRGRRRPRRQSLSGRPDPPERARARHDARQRVAGAETAAALTTLSTLFS